MNSVSNDAKTLPHWALWIVGIVGVWLLQRPPTGWRRAFLVLAGLYLVWTLAAIAVGVGVLFVPSAVCAVISALLANGV